MRFERVACGMTASKRYDTKMVGHNLEKQKQWRSGAKSAVFLEDNRRKAASPI